MTARTPKTAPADQYTVDAQMADVGGGTETARAASEQSTPMGYKPPGPKTAPADQGAIDAHDDDVGGGADPTISRSTTIHAVPIPVTSAGTPLPLSGQSGGGAHMMHAAEGAETAPGGHKYPGAESAHIGRAPGGDPFTEAVEATPGLLSLLAANVNDLEKMRIAAENRYRQATRNVPDADGEMRGFGLDERNIYVRQAREVLDAVKEAEHTAVLSLQRAMRRHPMGPWVKSQRGLGEKQVARLLGAIGDPYIRPALIGEDDKVIPARPRRVAELWSYCGMRVDGGRAVRKKAGEVANWHEDAKMRTFLIAESVLKQLDKTCPVDPEVKAARHVEGCRCSPYRKVYDEARLKHADAVHGVDCYRCGPAGRPAPAGSPLSDGHKHARAMRAAGKAVLKELWREARRLHTGLEGDEPPALG